MTDFKVTDEAVEAALSACSEHFTGPDSAMRTAIEAALPVMFESVGFFDPDVIAHYRNSNIDPVGVIRRKPNDFSNFPIFVIKEPK